MKLTFISTLLMMSIFLISCSQQKTPSDPVPSHEIFKIKSHSLGETRVMTIWTPPGYSTSENSYPVLYMLDGGVHEDFPHIANTIADLVAKGDIAPLIIVGIENTERRRDLTGPSEVEADAKIAPIADGASIFRDFIQKELFPEVAKRFRVNNKKAIVGESVAGLFIVETMLMRPELFDIYIAMDPSLWWNNHRLVKEASDLLIKLPENSIKLWFAGSDAEDISQYTELLSKELKSNAPRNLKWTYLPQPKEQHHTIFRVTKERAFRWGLWKDK